MRDLREETLNNIVMAAESCGIKDLLSFKSKLYVVLDCVELTDRSTELAVMDEDRNESMIRRFLVSKKVKGCSDRTIELYNREVRKAVGRIGKSIDEITADDIRLLFALRMTRDKVSNVTAGNEQRALSSFFTYLQTEELIPRNPMAKVERIKNKKTKKKAFTELEVEKMRAAYITNKEKAILEFVLSTWCRASEIASIKIADIKPNGSVLVLGKGAKERFVYLNARAQISIDTYLKERKDQNPYLFPKMKTRAYKSSTSKEARSLWCRKKGHTCPELVEESEPMGKEAANGYLKRIGRRAGVEGTHAHRFRRTGATFALRRGMPIIQVSKLLGHEELSTTQIYLDLTERELEQAHEKYVT